jgi:hypothetical protein
MKGKRRYKNEGGLAPPFLFYKSQGYLHSILYIQEKYKHDTAPSYIAFLKYKLVNRVVYLLEDIFYHGYHKDMK